MALSAQGSLRGTVSVTGEIRKLLCDFASGQLYLLCENGELAVLPDCPKCLKLLKVSDQPLTDGVIGKDTIELWLADGSKVVLPKSTTEQFRVSVSYAKTKLPEERADEAARYARRYGWLNAFSLGGVKEGFHR